MTAGRLVVVLVALVLCVSCTTFYVSPEGNDNNSGTSTSSPLLTIRKGIEKATASSGQLVLMTGLFTGLENVGLTLTSSISISAQPNAVVSCKNMTVDSAFISKGSAGLKLVLDGFTISDCSTGILLLSGRSLSTITVQNVLFTNNRLGVDLQSANLTISQSSFTNSERGILQDKVGKAALILSNTVFNNITYDALVYNSCGYPGFVDNCIFSGCGASAISTSCDMTISQSVFKDNQAEAGAAIDCQTTKNTRVYNCSFTNNASYRGGAININPKTNLFVENSLFSDNVSDLGGGIYNQGNLTVTNTNFSKNVAKNSGGGIACQSGTNTLVNLFFSDNVAPKGSDLACASCTSQASNVTLSPFGSPSTCTLRPLSFF